MYFASSWIFVLCPGHAPIVYARMFGRTCRWACFIRVHLHFYVSLRKCLRFTSNDHVATDCQHCFLFALAGNGDDAPGAGAGAEAGGRGGATGRIGTVATSVRCGFYGVNSPHCYHQHAVLPCLLQDRQTYLLSLPPPCVAAAAV
jgi:hypothetical protein